MPRIADHAERRRQVVEAATRVIAARGTDGPTVAEVAAEAGVSVGLVQRYFPTKDEMLLLTFESLGARLAARLTRAWEADGPARERLRRCLLELLPLDDERSAEMRVYVAFCGRAVGSAALRRVQVALHSAARADLASTIAHAQSQGEIPPGRDPAEEAALLWAMVDGLALHACADPAGLPPRTAERLVDRHLEGLFR
ncbi:TetR/AcrR family transcriptional regulator [Streptomyces sp. NPDC000070]|uniref:TetR/AcrR family transcriptional regulator n=1 Tax=Streptomyces sp. NPDC000070 TaxID=3154240 RepID=UPI00333121BE